MSQAVKDAIEAAHRAIDNAVAESAQTRGAAALERIADSLQKIERHLSTLADAKAFESVPNVNEHR